MNEEKKQPLISIIVPVFHVEKELPKCMESLLNQTERNIEIVLVDDGGNDGCPALCDGYAAQDARVQVIHKQNGGLPDARNAGMAVARGKWCLFVDSDDYIDADACERLLAIAQKAGNIDIVVGECEEHHGDASVFQQHTNLEEGKVYSASEYMKRAIPNGEFYMPVCFNLYRIDWLRQHQLQFAKGVLHDDMEWTPRLFLKNPQIVYIKDAFYHYVVRDGSISRPKDFSKNVADIMVTFCKWKKLFASVPDAELQSILNGFLCKSFIHVCAEYQVKDVEGGFKKSGLSRIFLFNKSRGIRAKCMAALMAIHPSVYYWLYERLNKGRAKKG